VFVEAQKHAKLGRNEKQQGSYTELGAIPDSKRQAINGTKKEKKSRST